MSNTNSVNNNQCSSIAAGQSCALSVTTPVLENLNTQGSIVIKASYSLNGQTQTFNQIINYAQVSDNLTPAGVKFTSGIEVSGYGNSTGYATIYLYGSGQNQIYNVSGITINNANITIINGDISGHQIQSHVVQAIEVSSPITSSLISATITVNSNTLNLANIANNSVKNSNSNRDLTVDQFSNNVDLIVEPVTAGAVLNDGLVPLINTVNGTNASLSIQNSGNKAAVVGNVSAESGISNLSGCSGQTLSPAAICTINFNVTESGGSSNIIIPYSGGSANTITANITWFHGANAAIVSMYANNNPVTFFATTGENTTVTVTNIGGYALNNISIPTPVMISGSATATVANDNCSSITLAINASCQYDVNVNDNVADLNKQIQLGFNASYAVQGGSRNYNREMILDYNSLAMPRYVYITNSGNNPSTISMYSINSGVLVPFSPESTVAAQKLSSPIRFTPSGANAYVVNTLGRNLSMFSVGSNGLFTPLIPESTVATQTAPIGLTFGPY